MLAPGFNREAMAGYHTMMLAVAERLTDHWDRAAGAGRTVDVPGDMTKLTLETIARTGFGHDFGSFERSRPHPFVTAMVGTLGYAQRLNAVPAPLAPLLLRSASRRNAADIDLSTGSSTRWSGSGARTAAGRRPARPDAGHRAPRVR
ncbi:hypothetical protein SHIRM173S_07108 [Streptomyces hirsutus]